MQPVYALALTNQVFDHDSEQYYHHYKIVNLQQPQRVLKGLEFVFIEIPKFKPQSSTERRMQVKWLRFLSEVGDNQHEPAADLQADQSIGAALKLVEVAAYSEAEIEAYHSHMDRARIESTVITDAKAQGKAEGRAETLAQLVKSMQASGMSAEQISQVTQLPLTEVQRSLGV